MAGACITGLMPRMLLSATPENAPAQPRYTGMSVGCCGMEYGSSMYTAHLSWHAALLRFKDLAVDQPAPERMNVFGISGFPNREIVSSNILAYFFDPANPH